MCGGDGVVVGGEPALEEPVGWQIRFVGSWPLEWPCQLRCDEV